MPCFAGSITFKHLNHDKCKGIATTQLLANKNMEQSIQNVATKCSISKLPYSTAHLYVDFCV